MLNLFGTQIDHLGLSKGFWKLAVSSGLPKMLKFGKWINNFYWWDIIKIIISLGTEKVQFTLTFYFKQNKEVQLDLRFEIFIFSSLFVTFALWENVRRKVKVRIFAIWNMNTFLNKRYFATYGAFSSSITIEIFHKVTWKLNLQTSFS